MGIGIVVAIVLAAVGLIADVFSLVLGIRRLRGDGPSGIPLVGLVLYLVAVMLVNDSLPLERIQILQLTMVAVAIHVVLQFGILLLLHFALKAAGK